VNTDSIEIRVLGSGDEASVLGFGDWRLTFTSRACGVGEARFSLVLLDIVRVADRLCCFDGSSYA
jgi:hypothetical protein